MAEYLYMVRLTRPQLLREGPTEAEAAALERHEAYLRRLTETGVVILAGRTQTDDERSFGVVVFRADSLEDAEGIMRDDPAVLEGVMEGELYPYRVAFRSDGPDPS